MRGKALLAVTVTMSVPGHPSLTATEDFSDEACRQIEALLKLRWPMLSWTVDIKGDEQ